jgi:hypothetical protein
MSEHEAMTEKPDGGGAALPRRPHGAGRRLSVRVEREVIDEATRADSSHCMIADAIRAQHPSASRIMVDLQTIRFTDTEKGKRYVWLTPALAQRALINFDQGIPVEPFDVVAARPVQIVAGEKREKGGKQAQRRGLSEKVLSGQLPLDPGDQMRMHPDGKPYVQRKRPTRQQPRKEVVARENDPYGQPLVVGGKALPNAVLVNNPGRGLLRRFGLRQLKP